MESPSRGNGAATHNRKDTRIVSQSAPILSLGDSLRAIAAVVDGAPSLANSYDNPGVPLRFSIGVRTRGVLEVLAKDLDVKPREYYSDTTGSLHTAFEITAGKVQLHVFNIEPVERELRRPVTVDEALIGGVL